MGQSAGNWLHGKILHHQNRLIIFLINKGANTWIITQPPYTHNFCWSKMAFNNRDLLYYYVHHLGVIQGHTSKSITTSTTWGSCRGKRQVQQLRAPGSCEGGPGVNATNMSTTWGVCRGQEVGPTTM